MLSHTFSLKSQFLEMILGKSVATKIIPLLLLMTMVLLGLR